MDCVRRVAEIVESKSECFSSEEYVTMMNDLKSIFERLQGEKEMKPESELYEEPTEDWISIDIDVESISSSEEGNSYGSSEEENSDNQESSNCESEEKESYYSESEQYSCGLVIIVKGEEEPDKLEIIVEFPEENYHGLVKIIGFERMPFETREEYVRLLREHIFLDEETVTVESPPLLNIPEWSLRLAIIQ